MRHVAHRTTRGLMWVARRCRKRVLTQERASSPVNSRLEHEMDASVETLVIAA